jgi:hypothetical protein
MAEVEFCERLAEHSDCRQAEYPAANRWCA